MKWIKALVYLVMAILVLQVVKIILGRQAGIAAFNISTIVIALQFLLVSGFVLLWAFYKVLQFLKLSPAKTFYIALAAVFAVFVTLELTAGYLLDNPRHIPRPLAWSFQYYYDRYDTRLVQYRENASVYDSGLFYTLRPSASFHYGNREFDNIFTTNSQGLRDDEASLAAPEIICLGDSYGLGWGVDQQETFAQCIEKKTGLTTLNAGISSYGTAREMKLLKRIDTSRLKYVVIQYCGNDYGENDSYMQNSYVLPVSPRQRFDSLVDVSRNSHQYFPGKHSLLIGQIFFKAAINKIAPLFDQPASRDDPFGNEKKQAVYFLEVLGRSGLNFEKVQVIVMVLDRYVVMKNNFLQELSILSNQSPYKERFAGKLRLVDLSDTLTRDDYYFLDLHINASGHRKTGEKILQAMQKP